MKKIVLGLMILLVSGAVFAQSFGVGVKGGTGFYNINKNQSGIDTGWNATTLFFGVFADATYARLQIDYEMSVGGQTYMTGFSPVSFTDTRFSYLNFTLLGKYPINLMPLKLWPALGIRHALALSYIFEGADLLSAADQALCDWYLVVGVGADIGLGGGGFFLTIESLYAYNLTANPSTIAPPSGMTITGSDIQIAVGIGYRF
jgi:hypothetical protein